MTQKLKIGFFATAFALLTTAIIAQPTLPTTPGNPSDPPQTYWTEFTNTGTHDETVDSVTVGSRMPYYVAPQTATTGLSFEYKWLFSPVLQVQDYAGATLPETVSGSNYYTANKISVVMPGTAGDITITTNVRSVFTATGTVLCDDADVPNTIRVLPRPTIKWDASVPEVGCVASAVTIPLTLTGNTQFEVAYIIHYYAGYDNTGTLTSSSSEEYVVLSGNNLVIPASAFPSNGLYEIEVTSITDRISRKSMDMTLVASQATDLPDDPFQVFVYPAPQANPLQHIRNMP